MNFPWSESFQLGMVVAAFFRHIRDRRGPVLEVLSPLADDPFFQALEVSGAEDRAVQEELAQTIRKSGKTAVFSGGAFCYGNQNNLHDLDEEKRRQAVANVCKIIDEAHQYGCGVLYVMGFEAPPDRRLAIGKFIASMAELGDYARKKNPSRPMTVSVENFYVLKDRPFLIGPTLELAQIIRDLRRDHPNIGLTFDTSHILQLKEDLFSTYRAVQDVIAHVHLSNCLLKDPASPFYGDKHPPYGLQGSEIGVPELAGFIRLLKDSGHFSRAFPTGKPVLSLEVITPAGQTPEAVLKEAKESFLKAWELSAGPNR